VSVRIVGLWCGKCLQRPVVPPRPICVWCWLLAGVAGRIRLGAGGIDGTS
jgi:hypothetical protein